MIYTASDDNSDPTPRRKALLEYIAEHGPLIAAHMTPAGTGAKQRLIWLQKEGYATCERSGTNQGALWSITPMGRRWIIKYDGTPVKPRTRAYSGSATDAPEVRWPDVRAGSMRAFEIQSRGIAT